VTELKTQCVEHLPIHLFQQMPQVFILDTANPVLSAAIGRVPHDRVPHVAEMHPYLMGAPGPNEDLHQGDFLPLSQDVPFRDRLFSSRGQHRHFLAFHRMSAQEGPGASRDLGNFPKTKA